MPAATPVWRARTADRVLATLEEHRATWQFWHLWAETQRQLRGANIHPANLRDVAASVMEEAITRSVRLTPIDDPADVPPEERRRDGASVFTVAGSTQYTSTRILAAEQRVLDAAALTDGQALQPAAVDLALAKAKLRAPSWMPGSSRWCGPWRRTAAGSSWSSPPPGRARPPPSKCSPTCGPLAAAMFSALPRPLPRRRSSPRPPASPPTPWPGSPGRSTTTNRCRTGPTGSVRRRCC